MQDLPPEGAQPRIIIQRIRELITGRSNAVGTVTLNASATSTTVKWPNGNVNAKVFLSPETASATTAWPNCRAVMTAADTITITHASNAATDQRFGFAVIGG